MTLSMHELFIYVKGLALLLLVWCTELFVVQIAGLSFISTNVREFLIESKEIISLITSIAVLAHIVIKIIKEKNNK